MARIRMNTAVNEALIEEMERDERVFLYGEDVGISLMGDTAGLQERFGPVRVRDTPICENLLSGMAVGAAAAGYRPICHLLYGNFVYTGFDAIANQAAKLRYMTGGQITLPVVYLAICGGGRNAAAQHSDSPHPALMNLGGVKVVIPSSPKNAKGLLKAAIRDDNPVFFLRSGGRGGAAEEMPDGDFVVPLGKAEVVREGSDATIVAIGAMVPIALAAAKTLANEGIEAEVIDPRTLAPLDEDTILSSVARTGRLIVVDEARDAAGAASHIAAIAADRAFDALKAPIKRLTVPDVAIPYSPPLEKAVIPDTEAIAAAVREAAQYSRSTSR